MATDPRDGSGIARSDGVRTVWRILRSLTGALLCIGVVFVIVASDKKVHLRHLNPVPFAVGLVVVGVVLYVVARRLERPLDGSSEAMLVRSYQARLFVWVGIGEFPVFLSILGVVLTDSYWLYLLGLVFAFAGFARVAPTAANLARDQQELSNRGFTLSVTQALSSMPSRRRFL